MSAEKREVEFGLFPYLVALLAMFALTTIAGILGQIRDALLGACAP